MDPVSDLEITSQLFGSGHLKIYNYILSNILSSMALQIYLTAMLFCDSWILVYIFKKGWEIMYSEISFSVGQTRNYGRK